MSFISALPVASIRYSYRFVAPLYTDIGFGTDRVTLFQVIIPPWDTGAGTDTTVSLSASITRSDTGLGGEPVARVIFLMQLLPWDQSFTYTFPTLLLPFGYSPVLVRVKPGDIIMPNHHNMFIEFWQHFVLRLKALSDSVSERKPELAEEYRAALSLFESVVSNTPIAREKEYVYSEHFNIRLDILDTFINILKFLIYEVLDSPSNLVEKLNEVQQFRTTIEKQMAGDVIRARDHNTLVDATLSAVSLLREIERAFT